MNMSNKPSIFTRETVCVPFETKSHLPNRLNLHHDVWCDFYIAVIISLLKPSSFYVLTLLNWNCFTLLNHVTCSTAIAGNSAVIHSMCILGANGNQSSHSAMRTNCKNRLNCKQLWTGAKPPRTTWTPRTAEPTEVGPKGWWARGKSEDTGQCLSRGIRCNGKCTGSAKGWMCADVDLL